MSQYDFGAIDPQTKTGTVLATDLNSWRDAVHSSHLGVARPSYVKQGMQWVDSSNAPNMVLYLFDGAADVLLFSFNTNSHTGSVPAIASNVSFSPFGDIGANNVQLALQELDSEKLRKTSNVGSAIIPVGTTAERDATPQSGYMRFNDDIDLVEVFDGTGWVTVGDNGESRAGELFDFAGTIAPSYAIARPKVPTTALRATYPELFAAIGTTWGAGDGSTTFGLPYIAANEVDLCSDNNVGTASTGEIKAHTHEGNWMKYATGAVGVAAGSNMTAVPIPSTGGTKNLAAGMRVLKCVRIR